VDICKSPCVRDRRTAKRFLSPGESVVGEKTPEFQGILSKLRAGLMLALEKIYQRRRSALPRLDFGYFFIR
jgi:hypothetical protein